ncbi:MAG: Tyrosine recombinase XerC [Phycisphaerales bacterium]|nr:Tyrosine recombinase XerC [Phycisphaerales bacterium]
MVRSTAKKGRPQASHRTSWGERVDGLTRLADGRWKVSGPAAVKFTEPDERLAVARFRALAAARDGASVLLPVDTAGLDVAGAFGKAATTGVEIRFAAGAAPAVRRAVPEAEFWATVRQLILERPKHVAQMTGIEQIGYLADLPRPTPSPALAEVGELYAARPNLSPNEAGRSRLFWREFVQATGAATVRDVDHDAVARYEAAVARAGLAPKSVLHRYRKVRTVLAYAIKRGRGPADCRRALDALAMLEVRDAHPIDPTPIRPDAFWAIHAAALAAGDATFAALMLTALNACMYSGEVAALKWAEVDLAAGELATARPKTKVGRVAKLWPETVAALSALPRRGEHVFHTSHRSYTTFSVLAAFRRYRQAAGYGGEVVFSALRDAAFTVACTAGSLEAARALAGHRLPGVTDFYLRRNVGFVAAACAAVRAAYVPAGPG